MTADARLKAHQCAVRAAGLWLKCKEGWGNFHDESDGMAVAIVQQEPQVLAHSAHGEPNAEAVACGQRSFRSWGGTVRFGFCGGWAISSVTAMRKHEKRQHSRRCDACAHTVGSIVELHKHELSLHPRRDRKRYKHSSLLAIERRAQPKA